MNKVAITIFVLILAVFGVIFYMTQPKNANTQSPTNALSAIQPNNSTSFISLPPTNQPQQPSQPPQQNQTNQPQPTFGVAEEPKATTSAVIKTSRGNIKITLFNKDAPNTVKNFTDKATSGFYSNLIFHRVENWVIQGGDPNGDGSGGGQMQTELNQIPFTIGSLGVARRSDINVSNDSQFFITKSDASWLNQQYTNFGIVTDGMDVVNKIQIGDKILGITIEK